MTIGKKFSAALLIGILMHPSASHAEPIAGPKLSKLYYKIGGAGSITAPANAGVVTQTIGGSISLGLGYSCGKFDPTLGVSNILNDLKNTGNNLINGAMSAVSAAIGSLPALIMQRVDPGLYDLFQNALIRAEAIISLAHKSCEQMEREIAEGKNPYQDWITLSKKLDWEVLMGSGSGGSTGGTGTAAVDVKTAQDTVEATNGANGLPWLGGIQAGGAGQPPIRVVYDIVFAGYNLTMNRPVQNAGAVSPGPSAPLLVKHWDRPQSAAEWAVDVVGEILIRTHDNRATEATPGHGLLVKIHAEKETIQPLLADLVSGATPSTLDNLRAISSGDTLITAELVQSIQRLDPTNQAVAIEKLSSEIAMARIMEKAVLVRRLLLTGRKEPNVYMSPAPGYIDEAVAEVDRYIDDILFEKRIHQELFAATSRAILDVESMVRGRAKAGKKPKERDRTLMLDGAVQ